jgi:hypothetical protein
MYTNLSVTESSPTQLRHEQIKNKFMQGIQLKHHIARVANRDIYDESSLLEEQNF